MNKKIKKAIDNYYQLKENSGSHSPSLSSIIDVMGIDKLNIDACFLSNPYATDLFEDYLKKDLIITGKLRQYLEFYPPQVKEIAHWFSKDTKIPSKNFFFGNGAEEIIEAVLQRFVSDSICIVIPTFSSYYEFISEGTDVHFFKLKKEDGYVIDSDNLIAFVLKNNIKNLVLINPNNPNGAYFNELDLKKILNQLESLDNIILDQSFSHFAYEDDSLSLINYENIFSEYKNLIIIKSMSKDFGIAGLRVGYSVMPEEKVEQLIRRGHLWNVSGLAVYFLKLYQKKEFSSKYEVIRKKYILNTLHFFNELKNLNNFKLYPSRANFILIECLNHRADEVFASLLINYGIYVRNCNDKIGLDGEFVRVASRTFEENLKIINAFKELDND
jgi:histidinol-phosphate/aromatic aminotransferase/cobyric acid decarboxylase-like protein